MTMSDFPLACPKQKTDPFLISSWEDRNISILGENSVMGCLPSIQEVMDYIPQNSKQNKNLMDEAWIQAKQTEVEVDLWRFFSAFRLPHFSPLLWTDSQLEAGVGTEQMDMPMRMCDI